MRSLSAAAILEKNKLAGDGAWLILLEIQLPGTTLRMVRNNVGITWGGESWAAFPFELDDASEDKQESPQIQIKVGNVSRVVQGYVEAAPNGGTGATVILRVVLSNHLDQAAEIEETFEVVGIQCDAQWVSITLGVSGGGERFPADRNMKDFCRFVVSSGYCGIECGVSAATKASYPTCNGTLAHCRERGNSVRFGGEPALPSNRYYGS